MASLTHITQKATEVKPSWTNKQVLAFHQYNNNGLLQQAFAVADEIDALYKAGVVNGGWTLYGAAMDYFDDFHNMGKKSRVGSTELYVLLKLVEEAIARDIKRIKAALAGTDSSQSDEQKEAAKKAFYLDCKCAFTNQWQNEIVAKVEKRKAAEEKSYQHVKEMVAKLEVKSNEEVIADEPKSETISEAHKSELFAYMQTGKALKDAPKELVEVAKKRATKRFTGWVKSEQICWDLESPRYGTYYQPNKGCSISDRMELVSNRKARTERSRLAAKCEIEALELVSKGFM